MVATTSPLSKSYTHSS